MTFGYKLRKAFRLDTYTRRALPERLRVAARAAARAVLKAFRLDTYADRWTDLKVDVAARRTPRVWNELKERKKKIAWENLAALIDPAETARIRARYADGAISHWTKYLDFEKWVKVNIRYAHRLKIVEEPPGDVLDIGCGGGYFLFICRQLGCRALGIDLDTDAIFNDIVRLLGVERIGWRVEPFVKLPDLGREFDLITAFMITFNNFDTPDIWRPAAWGFLIDDLHERLRPGGRLFFSLNQQLDGKLYDDDLLALFESKGAHVNGKELLFTKERLDAARAAAPSRAARPSQPAPVHS